MPDITWTPDFRLAVIEKIGTRCLPAICVEAVVLMRAVAHKAPWHLCKFIGRIESALGCTLQAVQEEMERNAE